MFFHETNVVSLSRQRIVFVGDRDSFPLDPMPLAIEVTLDVSDIFIGNNKDFLCSEFDWAADYFGVLLRMNKDEVAAVKNRAITPLYGVVCFRGRYERVIGYSVDGKNPVVWVNSKAVHISDYINAAFQTLLSIALGEL
ncbi:MAG: hypothetical protein CUN56_08860 [Phototrophicales bacterium]|nr:MAG: hypothetical protein CUN56_08860 [Phototrophicales bacterium]